MVGINTPHSRLLATFFRIGTILCSSLSFVPTGGEAFAYNPLSTD
jgi:hypothetical protein